MLNKTKIKIKKLNPEAIIPRYAHEGDAGMDAYSLENCVLQPGERKTVPTGISFELPIGYEIQIRPRSGLALNHGITLSNTPGTLDSGYRGELKVGMINLSGERYDVKKGERIAQLVLAKHETAEIEEVKELNQSSRGENGFGSTGK